MAEKTFNKHIRAKYTLVMHKLATLAYLLHENEILLLYRNKKKNDFHEGKYVGIGGRLEPGETPLECVIREIKEEAGYEFESSELAFRGYIYFDEISRKKESEDLPAFNWLVFIYTAIVEEKKIYKNSEGELHWFLKNKVPYENMWGGDRVFTPKILETDEIIEGKFLYRDNSISWWTFGRD